MSRILVLVLSFDAEPWLSIELEGQRQTWAQDPPPGVQVLFYYGLTRGPTYWLSKVTAKALKVARLRRARSAFIRRMGRWSSGRPARRVGSRIHTGVPESYVNTNAKLRAALRHALATDDFDYLLRTNTSSYVHLPGLQRFVADLSAQAAPFYGGFLGAKSGISYASGAGILISRDVAEAVATDPAWEYDLVDDVAVGSSVERLGIRPTAIPRIDIPSPRDEISSDRLRDCYLVRCRGQSCRSHDVLIMRRVHAGYASLERG